jgi:hypothetical protein
LENSLTTGAFPIKKQQKTAVVKFLGVWPQHRDLVFWVGRDKSHCPLEDPKFPLKGFCFETRLDSYYVSVISNTTNNPTIWKLSATTAVDLKGLDLSSLPNKTIFASTLCVGQYCEILLNCDLDIDENDKVQFYSCVDATVSINDEQIAQSLFNQSFNAITWAVLPPKKLELTTALRTPFSRLLSFREKAKYSTLDIVMYSFALSAIVVSFLLIVISVIKLILFILTTRTLKR